MDFSFATHVHRFATLSQLSHADSLMRRKIKKTSGTRVNFWSPFSAVFALKKKAVFRFWRLVRFAGFLQFSPLFCPMYFTVFLVLLRKLV